MSTGNERIEREAKRLEDKANAALRANWRPGLSVDELVRQFVPEEWEYCDVTAFGAPPQIAITCYNPRHP